MALCELRLLSEAALGFGGALAGLLCVEVGAGEGGFGCLVCLALLGGGMEACGNAGGCNMEVQEGAMYSREEK